jgi:hypothetical protein
MATCGRDGPRLVTETQIVAADRRTFGSRVRPELAPAATGCALHDSTTQATYVTAVVEATLLR